MRWKCTLANAGVCKTRGIILVLLSHAFHIHSPRSETPIFPTFNVARYQVQGPRYSGNYLIKPMYHVPCTAASSMYHVSRLSHCHTSCLPLIVHLPYVGNVSYRIRAICSLLYRLEPIRVAYSCSRTGYESTSCVLLLCCRAKDVLPWSIPKKHSVLNVFEVVLVNMYRVHAVHVSPPLERGRCGSDEPPASRPLPTQPLVVVVGPLLHSNIHDPSGRDPVPAPCAPSRTQWGGRNAESGRSRYRTT